MANCSRCGAPLRADAFACPICGLSAGATPTKAAEAAAQAAAARRRKLRLILAIAAVNAFLVAGYLMHLLSEKKLVYTVLAFTVFFAIGLFGLTIWATNGFPPGTASH